MVTALAVRCSRCGGTVLAFPRTFTDALDALITHYKEVHPRRWRARHRRDNW